MADVKWIKIVTDLFEDEKILLIDAMDESDSLIIIWFKLLCLAGKQNRDGELMLSDSVPYTAEMLATVFRRPVETIMTALKVFKDFGMIWLKKNGTICIANWEKHQNIEQMEKIREYNRIAKQKSRARLDGQENVNDMSNDVKLDNTLTSSECQGIDKIREEKIREEKKRKDISINHSRASADDKMKKYGIHRLVLMTEEQYNDLKDRLSEDELEKYLHVIEQCEHDGKTFKKKTHYQAILDMADKDRKVEKPQPKDTGDADDMFAAALKRYNRRND